MVKDEVLDIGTQLDALEEVEAIDIITGYLQENETAIEPVMAWIYRFNDQRREQMLRQSSKTD